MFKTSTHFSRSPEHGLADSWYRRCELDAEEKYGSRRKLTAGLQERLN